MTHHSEQRFKKWEEESIQLEKQLYEKLLHYLPIAIEKGINLFINEAHPPISIFRTPILPIGQELWDLSVSIQTLREKMGKPEEEGIGAIFQKACQEASDWSNDQRRGPKKLAEWVLMEIQK